MSTRGDFFCSIVMKKVNEGVAEEAARSENTKIVQVILNYLTYLKVQMAYRYKND